MLIANRKHIDTASVRHLLAAGEKNIDQIKITVDRFYLGEDLSGGLFTLRAINSHGELLLQNLEKEVLSSKIILTWHINETFTAVPGILSLEIVCYQGNIVVLKYEMTPMVVRGSILEQYQGGVDAIEKALLEMQNILEQAKELTTKSPMIQNGNWWLYDAESGKYIDSGYSAQGQLADFVAITNEEIDAILNDSISDDPDNPDAEEITNEEIDRLF